jgi:hypothetical protein
LFGLEQLLHGHRLVDMVFGSHDLLTGDQEPHVRVYSDQVAAIQIGNWGVKLIDAGRDADGVALAK